MERREERGERTGSVRREGRVNDGGICGGKRTSKEKGRKKKRRGEV